MSRAPTTALVALVALGAGCTLDFNQFLDGAANYDAGDVTFNDSGDPGCPNPQLLVALDRTAGADMPGAVARFSISARGPHMCSMLGGTTAFPSHVFAVTGLADGRVAAATESGPQFIDVARNLNTPYSTVAGVGNPVDIVAFPAPDGSPGVAVAYLATSGSRIAAVKQSWGLDQSRVWSADADGGTFTQPATSMTVSPSGDLWFLVPGMAAAAPLAPFGGSTTSTTIADPGMTFLTIHANAGRVVWVGPADTATAVYYANASDMMASGPTHCGGGVCGSQMYRHAVALPYANLVAAICDDSGGVQRVVMWSVGSEEQCQSLATTSTLGTVYTMRRLGVLQ
jgi:hypothetical protein